MSFKKQLLAPHPSPYSLFFHHGSCKKWWHLEQSLRPMWWDRVSRPILCCSPLDYDMKATWTLISLSHCIFFTYLFTAALSVTAPNWKEPRCLSMGKWLSLPWWLRWWRICLQCRRPMFNSWVGKICWRRKWQPTPVFLPGEFHDRGAWWATVYGVAKSWTRLRDYHSLSKV